MHLRPTWNHLPIKDAAAAEIVQDVWSWALAVGAIGEEDCEKQFLALLSVCLRESNDAYHAGRYLEDFLGWPVDHELIKVLAGAFRRLPYLTQEAVREWVLQTSTRFPACKGQRVRCRIGDVEFIGNVVDVIRPEARAIVATIRADSKNVSVNAEEVLEVVSVQKVVDLCA